MILSYQYFAGQIDDKVQARVSSETTWYGGVGKKCPWTRASEGHQDPASSGETNRRLSQP